MVANNPDVRPLPTVVGPTETALRALLERTLTGTAIDGYPAWVVINGAARADSDNRWPASVAAALRATPEVVGRVIERLAQCGLLDETGALTDQGRQELAVARAAVVEATAMVLVGIDAADEQAARRVLDRMRHNAEHALAVGSG